MPFSSSGGLFSFSPATVILTLPLLVAKNPSEAVKSAVVLPVKPRLGSTAAISPCAIDIITWLLSEVAV